MSELSEHYADLRLIAQGVKKVEKWTGPWKAVYKGAGKPQILLANATYAACQAQKRKAKATGSYNLGEIGIVPDRLKPSA
jgi:hypothetical protein